MGSGHFYRRQPVLIYLTMLFLLIGSGGCREVRFISEYDPVIDRQTTELQKKVGLLLLDLEEHLGTISGSYELFEERYDEITVDLQALQMRADLQPKNKIQQDQLKIMAENLERLETAHREGMESEEVELFRRGFEQSFRAILKLELAKKEWRKDSGG